MGNIDRTECNRCKYLGVPWNEEIGNYEKPCCDCINAQVENGEHPETYENLFEPVGKEASEMTRREKINAMERYCDSFEDCRCGCLLLKPAQCELKNFEELTDEELEACLEIINGKSVFIQDSGNRREFETGAVRDMQEGKGRMDLLPWAAIIEVSKHCEAGAKKYGEHNVDKGIPTNSLCDSAARHLAKYLDGWTDENHLLAAAWNLLWCIEMTIKKPEMVNTPFEIKVSKNEQTRTAKK